MEVSFPNVKEHATLSAGASVDHGVDVEVTKGHVNSEADRGCVSLLVLLLHSVVNRPFPSRIHSSKDTPDSQIGLEVRHVKSIRPKSALRHGYQIPSGLASEARGLRPLSPSVLESTENIPRPEEPQSTLKILQPLLLHHEIRSIDAKQGRRAKTRQGLEACIPTL